MASRSPRPRVAGPARSCCCPPPTTAPAGTARDLPPVAGPAPLLRPGRRAYLARVDALRAWADGRDGVHVGRRRAQRPRGAGGVAGGDRRATPSEHGLVRHVHATSSRASSRSAAPSTAARRSSCSTAPASSARARASSTASTSTPTTSPAGRQRHDRRLLPDDRGQPRRRPLPRAGVPRRGRADRDRQRLAGARRPVRGGARARDARPPRAPHAPRAARRDGDLWGELARNGRASLGLDGRRDDRVDRDHPDLRGVAEADLPLAIATCASAAGVIGREEQP